MLRDNLSKILGVALLLAAIVRIWIVAVNEVHWDEFLFLCKVHEHSLGSLAGVFQTIHVHGFKWLSFVSNNEVDQIVAARALMLLFQIATGWLIYGLAKEICSRSASLFAALCYSAFSYVMLHGTSFRADPIVTCLLMFCIYLSYKKHPSYYSIAAVGLLIALSLMITVKSVFYLPTIMVVFLLRAGLEKRRREIPKYLSVLATSFATFLALFYVIHRSTVTERSAAAAVKTLSGAYEKVILLDTFLPKIGYFRTSLATDRVFWIFAALGLVYSVVWVLRRQSPSKFDFRAIILWALALPLCTLMFYRNAFPYYYVLILAPVSISCAAGWDALMTVRSKGVARLIAALAVSFCVISLVQNGFVRPRKNSLARQREFVQIVHEMFPHPVPYVDRCGMLSSYPWAGFFMSTWGIESYRKNAVPLLSRNIRELQPKFVIANIPQLDFERRLSKEVVRAGYELLDEDLITLRENYRPLWGPLYVAGRAFTFDRPAQCIVFDTVIEGRYYVETNGTIDLDGKVSSSGESVYLKAGGHNICSREVSGPVTLTWGRKDYGVGRPVSTRPLFSGF